MSAKHMTIKKKAISILTFIIGMSQLVGCAKRNPNGNGGTNRFKYYNRNRISDSKSSGQSI